MEKLFYELKGILKNMKNVEFPSILPREEFTQEISQIYKEMYDILLRRVSGLNEHGEFSQYSPLLLDYVDIPIYCKDIDDICKLLETEESIPDFDFNDPITQTTDFVTAGGNAMERNFEKNKDCADGIDKESGIEEKIIERIKFEIIDSSPEIQWSDIVGLESIKKSINEIVVWPMQRPDIFTGLRAPPKGLLLFGPPGTGKTMIGKCIASQCSATFFSISASSLTSKWVGEGEKMVRALFFLARKMQPSVVFIDEIDSLLSQRQDNENDGMRRIKTEFLVQFDGASTSLEDKILIIGATNRPHEIDEAARRRLVKRIYVPLPDSKARILIIQNLFAKLDTSISEKDLIKISDLTNGYSGSDMFNLCREASMEPIREIVDIKNADTSNTRPINLNDFVNAVKQIKKSVCEKDLKSYIDWNTKFGST